MSATATVTFTFDGTRKRYEAIYAVVCVAVAEVALDIGTYFEGTQGSIEFMIDDFGLFEEKIERCSTEIGVQLVSMNFLASEQNKPNQSV
jgi:hypothetical protein